MKQAINIGHLLPMYATRKYSNDEWDTRISKFVSEVIQKEPQPWKLIGHAAMDIGFYPCYSKDEKRYVFERLDKISQDLRNEEINNGNYQEFLDGAERLLNASDVLENTKDALLSYELGNLEDLNNAAKEHILGILKELYPWYNWVEYGSRKSNQTNSI